MLTNTDFGKYLVQAFLCFHIVSHCFKINPLNAELNPICHLLRLLGAHRILHVSRIRVNGTSHLINSFVLVDHIDLVLVQCLLCRRNCDKVTFLQIIHLTCPRFNPLKT